MGRAMPLGRIAGVALALLALAGCSDTLDGAPVPSHPGGGSSEEYAGTIVGTGGSAMIQSVSGKWRLSDNYGHSCDLTLTGAVVRTGAYRAARDGCSIGLDRVTSWRPSGQNIVLTDSSDTALASLAPGILGGYSGVFASDMFPAQTVYLSRM